MINGIRSLCFKKLTEKSMQEEAKEKERARLRKIGKLGDFQNDKFKGRVHKCDENNHLIHIL